jgi:hypothetical protein
VFYFWRSTGELQIPQEALYKKNVLLVRGRFNPFTNLHNDMLMGAANQFFCHPSDGGLTVSDTFEECVFRDDTSVVLEITTKDMMEVNTHQQTPITLSVKCKIGKLILDSWPRYGNGV